MKNILSLRYTSHLVFIFLLNVLLRYLLKFYIPFGDELSIKLALKFAFIGSIADFLPVLFCFFLSVFTTGYYRKMFFKFSHFSMIVILLIDLMNLLFVVNTLEPINYNNLKVIYENFNYYAIVGFLTYKSYLFIVGICLFIVFAWHKLGSAAKLLECYPCSRKEKMISSSVLSSIILVSFYFNNPSFWISPSDPVQISTKRYVYMPTSSMLNGLRVDVKLAFYPYNEKRLSVEAFSELEKEYLKNLGDGGLGIERGYGKIIIVVIESMNRDFIHFYNPNIPEDVTPFLDSLCNDYLAYDNFYCASLPTDYGLHALLCSRLDFEKDSLRNDLPSLFSVLRDNGYKSLFISGEAKSYGRHYIIYPKLFQMDEWVGGEEFYKMNRGKYDEGYAIRDEVVFDEAIKWLKEQSGKYIALVKTYDLHPPYRSYDTSEEVVQKYDSLFLKQLYSFDKNLQHFYQNLKKYNILDEDTLVIITADHTATHGENYTKRSNYEPEKIPLIFLTQDFAKIVDRKKYSSQIDLPVTILRMLNIPAPDSFMGSNLFAKSSVAISKWKNSLILRTEENGAFKRIDIDLHLNAERGVDDLAQSAMQKWYYCYY